MKNELFTNGQGEIAASLKLYDVHGKYLGGWGIFPLADKVANHAAHVLEEKTPGIRADERLKVLREIQRVALDTFGKSRGRKSVNDHIGELVRQMDSDLTVAQVAKEMTEETR